jgi:hypothetical protein
MAGNLSVAFAIQRAAMLATETAMKKMVMCALLALCSCATSSGALGRRKDPLAGRWRGELLKGVVRSPADFEFAGRDGDYSGTWLSPARTVALVNVQLGSPVLAPSGGLGNMRLGSFLRFEVPQQVHFEGILRDNAIEGTFLDGQGGGSFTLEKQPENKDGPCEDPLCGLGDG